ncbi:metal-dependent phosphohydrolase [Salmonella enterica subsp. enterica serovar Senftenberg str. A4-543]|uniref:Metal-dependent phosphohydrolase n=1 Tax=Salmonella enterica subsp. enterica serovar Senftenberg str. A4-543 TaxID=913082 RepID=G5QYD5_SALSE|nr:metal-dependent phosphohydrolase [Salmonella enterica subsp. enterica serovar Senftenberg str. A4-543]
MPPMTSSIFVVFGQPRKRWGKTVLLTGWWCYRHVISMTSSAWRKIIRSGIVLPFWRRQKPGVFFCGIFLTFRQKNWRAFVMLSKRIASAQKLRLKRIASAQKFAKIAPTTPEAKIVQDADRLEALGAIGLARVFAVSGALGVALFDADDPFADRRPLNDKQFALDHFQTKLLKLPLTMQTERGKYLAQRNADFLVSYMAKLSAELKGDYETRDEAVIQMFATHQ